MESESLFCYDRVMSESETDDVIPLLKELSRQVTADVEAYRTAMFARGVRDVYDSAYYIHIVENVGNYFANADWTALEQISDTDLFVRFISTKKPFLHSFMEWVNEQDGVDASGIKAIEDEIFDFIIERAD